VELAPPKHKPHPAWDRTLFRKLSTRSAGAAGVLNFAPRRASDYRCASCGYEISIPKPHPGCPMCAGTEWLLIATNRQVLIGQW
jgi:hypothetical protein